MRTLTHGHFGAWLAATRARIRQNGGKKKCPQKEATRAVPAIEIDTELANRQYENMNEIEHYEQEDEAGADSFPNQNLVSPDNYEHEFGNVD